MEKTKERIDWDEAGGWDKTQIMEGLSSYLKGFGLYSKSHEEPLKGLKSGSNMIIFYLKKITIDKNLRNGLKEGKTWFKKNN